MLKGVHAKRNLDVIADKFSRIFFKIMKADNVQYIVHCGKDARSETKMRIDILNRLLKSTYMRKMKFF